MASRLAQRRRAPGLLHLPPPSRALSRQATASPPPEQLSVEVPTATADAALDGSSPRIPSAPSAPINTSTAPMAIPPAPQITSPYYSPSQVFPSSNAAKSYFPSYLSQSPQRPQQQQQPQRQSHSLSPQKTPRTPRTPKTPRSPSIFAPSANSSPRSPRDPVMFLEKHHQLQLSSTPTSAPFTITATSNSNINLTANSSMNSEPNYKFTSSSSTTTASPLSGIVRGRPVVASTTATAARNYHVHLAQQQLAFQMQQRELIYQATRAATTAMGPISPRLLPLGSPGPVTPLTLEDNPAGYLLMPSSGILTAPQALQLQQHHLEKLAAAAALAEQESASSAAIETDNKPTQL